MRQSKGDYYPALLRARPYSEQTVNTNRTAAIALAVRAQEVTTYIVDRATELHADRQPDGEGAVMKLRQCVLPCFSVLPIPIFVQHTLRYPGIFKNPGEPPKAQCVMAIRRERQRALR
jgi:hypothetical protein